MALHRLTRLTIGVPDVATSAGYYTEFGLTPTDTTSFGGPVPFASFATVDGGEQLRLVTAPHRQLVEMRIGADDTDDLERIGRGLASIDMLAERSESKLRTYDSGTEVSIVVELAPRIDQAETPPPPYNMPGHIARPDARAPSVLREAPVQPRKLGHVVLGSADQERSQKLFTDGLGFKVSDAVPGLATFLRCSTDHHNVLVQQAPIPFLHHTSWQVNDIDDVGRGATAMLEKDPSRHVWGLGRHHVGSNFFWYLRDPAGNFSEYYSDLDCIVDDALWTPRTFEGMHALYSWGPPPPPSFLAPEDLAALMTGAHGSR
ncbi:VOC family protein [Streptomyces sp. NPDC052051]|uniref:VOC family protein n=1 Tax=Streptomyces sp. NPDC052051 TaxID=3154649 RepID=UPI00342FBCAC